MHEALTIAASPLRNGKKPQLFTPCLSSELRTPKRLAWPVIDQITNLADAKQQSDNMTSIAEHTKN
jgi:hypothetical protein